MKGTVVLQLNDDDTITMQATVLIDADRARPYHFGFDWEDEAMHPKIDEMLKLIRASFVGPSKIQKLS